MLEELPKIKRYFGFKEQSEFGTAEEAPEMFADIKSLNVGIPSDPEIQYESSMEKGKTIHRPGYYVSTPSVEFGTDLALLNRLLYFVLGEKKTETEELNTINYMYPTSKVLLPFFTSFFGADSDEFIVPDCVIDKLEFNVENEFLTLKAEMKAGKTAVDTLKEADEITLNESYPLAFYEINVHMREKEETPTAWGEATLISSELKKLSLSIENGISEDNGQGLGSRFPYRLPSGAREIGLSFDYLYLSRKWLNYLWGSETGPQDNEGSTEFEMLIEIDAGDYGSGAIFIPRATIKGSPIEASGRDAMVQSVEVDTYMDTITIPTTPATTVKAELLATMVYPT